ncbi:MAG: DUF3293 domain-containing protein [Gemmatimonadaceae bacterium]
MVDADSKPLDERWGSYPETVLIFAGETEIFVDLREPVPPATRGAFEQMGLGGTFSILTAFNPRGIDISPEENDRRMAELERELESSGDELLRVDACSPDRSHCECSVALKGEMGRALEIARRWEQIAIFWWDGSTFWIQGALNDGHLRLPV